MRVVLILIIVGFITGFVANFYFGTNEKNTSRIKIGETAWNMEVVSSLGDREKGLSGRESLEENTGMLFVFPESDFHGIWMKGMQFSIDIIWLDKDYVVVDFERSAEPESYPKIFRPRTKSAYVLELNAGDTDRAKIKIGDKLERF